MAGRAAAGTGAVGTSEGAFTVYDQDNFFKAHLAPWGERFFADLASAESAELYRTVGEIGQVGTQVDRGVVQWTGGRWMLVVGIGFAIGHRSRCGS